MGGDHTMGLGDSWCCSSTGKKRVVAKTLIPLQEVSVSKRGEEIK